MENHPIPRQVITFEFKLIGFLTIKQFGYALLFVLFAALVYLSVPIPVLNIMAGSATLIFGMLFVFVKINERSLDIWIKNLIVALITPPQYFYHKKNEPPDFLKDIYVQADPKQIEHHVDAHQKLSNYIAIKQGQKSADQIQNINNLFNDTFQSDGQSSQNKQQSDDGQSPDKIPFVSGVIKTPKGVALSDIMIYIKNSSGQVVRILKTNHRGVFASFRPFPDGSYIFEPKDLSGRHFFDTIDLIIQQKSSQHSKPLAIFSKNIL